MIQINREEKDAIRERFPDICIVRTMKQDSKRHHYFMEEAPRALRFLNRLRGIEEPPVAFVHTDRKRGVRHQ